MYKTVRTDGESAHEVLLWYPLVAEIGKILKDPFRFLKDLLQPQSLTGLLEIWSLRIQFKASVQDEDGMLLVAGC